MPYNPGPKFRVSSEFGLRPHPIFGTLRFHGGRDFVAPIGTPIPSAAGGTIWMVQPHETFGNMVIVRHKYSSGEIRFSLYAHMNELPNFQLGQTVQAGEIIGVVGNTGQSRGAHLHFEVIQPVDGVSPRQGVFAKHVALGIEGPGFRINPRSFDFETGQEISDLPVPPERPFDLGWLGWWGSDGGGAVKKAITLSPAVSSPAHRSSWRMGRRSRSRRSAPATRWRLSIPMLSRALGR
jgi:murein DD-endopeptidase MepM/ murein hydrolase activator NlpD